MSNLSGETEREKIVVTSVVGEGGGRYYPGGQQQQQQQQRHQHQWHGSGSETTEYPENGVKVRNEVEMV